MHYFFTVLFLVSPEAGLCNQKLEGETLIGFFFFFTSWISCNTGAKNNFYLRFQKSGHCF